MRQKFTVGVFGIIKDFLKNDKKLILKTQTGQSSLELAKKL